MRAIVSGMIATYPVGGVAWDYGQYALGLERLGFEVYYLEDTGGQTYDPTTGYYGDDCRYGVEFMQSFFNNLSPTLAERWHFRSMDGKTYGMSAERISEIVSSADLFLNVSGSALLRDEYMVCKRKVLIDTDPGWNHFVNYPKWDKSPGWQDSHGYRAHDYYFTYAECIGMEDCVLPTLGIDWMPTRPPVVMDCWKSGSHGGKWTTVLTWNNYNRDIEYKGVKYGTKELEFKHVEELPSRTSAAFEIAIGGSNPPCDHLQALGWSVVSSENVSRTPDDYREYIKNSRGEFSVAKNVYVQTNSGWFSCRSVCYLAAGLPVVVQDTGFSKVIPSGKGLLSFKSLAEAIKAIEAVEADYKVHQQYAAEIAREYFDAQLVLNKMLEQIGIA